jgi:hypothetical protein
MFLKPNAYGSTEKYKILIISEFLGFIPYNISYFIQQK